MTHEEQQALAGEINAALKPATQPGGQPPVRPVPLAAGATAAAVAAHQQAEEDWGSYLLSVPASKLTDEQKNDLTAGLAQWARENRR